MTATWQNPPPGPQDVPPMPPDPYGSADQNRPAPEPCGSPAEFHGAAAPRYRSSYSY